MKNLLHDLVKSSPDYLELRFHRRTSQQFFAQKGRVDVANVSVFEGVGVRTLVNGAWGFSSTAETSKAAISRAIEEARRNASAVAKVLASGKKGEQQAVRLQNAVLSKLDYIGPGFDEIRGMSIADKLDSVVGFERKVAAASKSIQSASCRYTEYQEEKTIVTSDGAACSLKIAHPEFRLRAIAEKDGEQVSFGKAAGVSGGWQCLFQHPALEEVVDTTAQLAVDLLRAKYPEGGKITCILAPSVVGLLCHEAIGHTVEADFVKAGSVAQGKMGQDVASSLVNLADSGREYLGDYAVGIMPFDDEGVETQSTMIIKDGKLASYLHNRETAAEFGVTPTGNARAWSFSDEPIIRMRNTFMLPGTSQLESMIGGVDEGYLVMGAGSGQADANGEFMFGTDYIWRIKDGKKTELLREATLSGMAFDVLKTVDAVSQEFAWDLGSGHCGKGQPAKVDAGGPYIRCKINVGGQV